MAFSHYSRPQDERTEGDSVIFFGRFQGLFFYDTIIVLRSTLLQQQAYQRLFTPTIILISKNDLDGEQLTDRSFQCLCHWHTHKCLDGMGSQAMDWIMFDR